MRVLVEAGVTAIEITTNTPGWHAGIAWAVERYGSAASVGVGTVLEPRQLDEAAAVGASFAVSPHTDAAIGERAHERGLGWYPGAATPTEIVRAWQLGARAVKVFPAAQLGGPAFLRQVLAPWTSSTWSRPAASGSTTPATTWTPEPSRSASARRSSATP